MKILVAYDGSINSKNALRYGIKKVSAAGGELIALNVFTGSTFVGYDAVPGCGESAYGQAMQHLDEAASIIRKEGKGIKASTILADGYPEEEIVNAAIEEKADLLLCPSKYKSVRKHFAAQTNVAAYADGRNEMLVVPIRTS